MALTPNLFVTVYINTQNEKAFITAVLVWWKCPMQVSIRLWQCLETLLGTHGNQLPSPPGVHDFKDFFCSPHLLEAFDGRIYSLKHLLVGAFNQEKALVKTPWLSLWLWNLHEPRLTFVLKLYCCFCCLQTRKYPPPDGVQTVQEIKYVCVLVMRIYLDTEATFSLSCAKQN